MATSGRPRKPHGSTRMRNIINKDLTDDADLSFNMYKAITESHLYNMKLGVETRSDKVRAYMDDNLRKRQSKDMIFPGMMVSFKYLKPKTKKELEYYDAMPVVIFFGIVNTKEGKRVLGFNLHYYPPQLRYRILSWMFDQFKAFFIQNWSEGTKVKIPDFDYRFITNELEKVDMGFGVRMYIPELMSSLKKVAPKYFQVAVFTEGVFKKQTRTQILRYWRNKKLTLF